MIKQFIDHISIPSIIQFDKNLDAASKIVYGIIYEFSINDRSCLNNNFYFKILEKNFSFDVNTLLSKLFHRDLIRSENDFFDNNLKWLDINKELIKKNETFTCIPTALFLNSKLNLLSILIFGEMNRLSNKKGLSFCSYSFLEKLFDLSFATIDLLIQSLVKEEYLLIDEDFLSKKIFINKLKIQIETAKLEKKVLDDLEKNKEKIIENEINIQEQFFPKDEKNVEIETGEQQQSTFENEKNTEIEVNTQETLNLEKKARNTYVDDINETLDDKTIADKFLVSASKYSNIYTSTLGFSTRATNCINDYHCDTLDKLLNIKISDLKKWRNLGRKTFEEIIQKCSHEVQNRKFCTESVFDFVNCTITSVQQILCNMDDSSLLQLAKNLIENTSNYLTDTDILINKLNEFKEKLVDFTVPSALLSYKVLPFARAFDFIQKENNIINRIKQDENFNELLLKVNAHKSLDWVDFFQFVNSNMEDIFNKIFYFDDEKKKILWNYMVDNLTLEEIGNKYNVSRQCIQQKREKILTEIKNKVANYHLIPLFFSFLEGKDFFDEKDLKKISGVTYFNQVLYLCKYGILGDLGLDYSKTKNIFIFTLFTSNFENEIKKFIDGLPDFLLRDEMDDRLIEFSNKKSLDFSLILNEVDVQFNKYLEFYSRKKFNLLDMCSYVLKNKFPSGINVNEKSDYNSFCDELVKQFNISRDQISENYFGAKLSEISFLYDKNIRMHNDYLTVDANTKDLIIDYIVNEFNQKRTALSYLEIFNRLSQNLSGTNIQNQYYLHSLLTSFNLPYYFIKDYVLKDNESSFENDFEDYIKENYPISVSKVEENFFLNDAQIYRFVSKSNKVIQKGKMLLYKW